MIGKKPSLFRRLLTSIPGLVVLGLALAAAGGIPGRAFQRNDPPQDLWVVTATITESITTSGIFQSSRTTKITPDDLVRASQVTIRKTNRMSQSLTASAFISAVLPNEGGAGALVFDEAQPVSVRASGSLREESSQSTIETVNGVNVNFACEEREDSFSVSFSGSEVRFTGQYSDTHRGFSVSAHATGEQLSRTRRFQDGQWKTLDPMRHQREGGFEIGAMDGEPGASVVRNGDTIHVNRTGSETTEREDPVWGTVTTVTRRTITATIRRFSNEAPRADPGGPYEVERGGTLTLDGSRSKGNLVSYQWTFAAAPDCRSEFPIGPGPKQGQTVTAVVLCPVVATLTVSDGTRSASARATVKVKPRDWKTAFEHVAAEGALNPAIPPRIDPHLMAYSGGANVCSLDPSQDENHSFHPGETNGTWDDAGYRLVQVDDPGGPFDRAWYPREYILRISRQTVINPYLLPGGRPPMTGIESWYEANAARGAAVDAYLKAIRDHEMEHSRRKRSALPASDPARKMEERFGGDRDKLKEDLDRLIREAEFAVCEASRDPLPLTWRGTLWFPRIDTGIYERGEVEVGGPHQIATPPCRR